MEDNGYLMDPARVEGLLGCFFLIFKYCKQIFIAFECKAKVMDNGFPGFVEMHLFYFTSLIFPFADDLILEPLHSICTRL